MISFQVKDSDGLKTIEIPEGISLSLMEVLKASDYSILATCGGMALCATCHVEVLQGREKLSAPGDTELDMLDMLPTSSTSSRLACQIRVDESLQGAVFEVYAPTQ